MSIVDMQEIATKWGMELKELYEEANRAFYEDGEKILTDEEYHAVKKALNILDSDTDFSSSTLTVNHTYPSLAGTLSKVTTIDELKTFINTRLNPSDTMAVSLKYDGFSCVIEYKWDGSSYQVDRALTRGREGMGKDLSKVVEFNYNRIVKPTPEMHQYLGDECAFAYEMVIMFEDFDKMLKEEKVTYKNPRNAVAGCISEPSLSKYLSFIPLKINSRDKELTRNRELDIIFTLTDMEGAYYNYRPEFWEILPDDREATITDIIQGVDLERYTRCMTDGLVFETVRDDRIEKYGYMDHAKTTPSFAVAFKFKAKEQETFLEDIRWSCEGYNVKFTPMAIFKPVQLMGNTYSAVSLANMKRFREGKWTYGDKLIFELRNDVLGYVNKVETMKPDADPIPRLELCPSCQTPLIETTYELLCPNTKCKLALIGHAMKVVDSLDIKFIGRELVTKLVDNGLITKPIEIITMDLLHKGPKVRMTLGDKTAKKLFDAINNFKRKGIEDYRLITCMNIEGIEVGKAKRILSTSIESNIIKLAVDGEATIFDLNVMDKINNIDGLGYITLQNLASGFDEEMVREVAEIFPVIFTSPKPKAENALTFCHTGSAGSFKSRELLKEAVENKGHTLTSSVSKKTNYLVCDDQITPTTKLTKAKELNIPIITTSELEDLLNE